MALYLNSCYNKYNLYPETIYNSLLFRHELNILYCAVVVSSGYLNRCTDWLVEMDESTIGSIILLTTTILQKMVEKKRWITSQGIATIVQFTGSAVSLINLTDE